MVKKNNCKIFFLILFTSCTIYDKIFDNPVDFKANQERGIGAPTFVFYPKTQTVSQSDSVLIGSYIVFEKDSTEPFSGVHVQITFPDDMLKLDTILPGLFITDTNQSIPLFTYTYDGFSQVDIYTYFLDTLKKEVEGTGHLADIILSPLSSGIDSIHYNLENCRIIDYEENQINVNGDRGAEIVVQ